MAPVSTLRLKTLKEIDVYEIARVIQHHDHHHDPAQQIDRINTPSRRLVGLGINRPGALQTFICFGVRHIHSLALKMMGAEFIAEPPYNRAMALIEFVRTSA
jgi:hypothetical protein